LGSTGNVIVSGRRSFFYIYDAVAGNVDLVPRILGRQEKSLEKFSVSPDGSIIAFYGNDGYIILVDVRTKEWIADLKMNGSVRAITFSANGDYLYASGSDGQVYQWETASRRCVDRFDNQDGTITSSMACSSQHLAVGAESGVVNLYQSKKQQLQEQQSNQSSILSSRQPIKSIMNLHTSSDLVRFNTDGQILAMSSRRERQALKLVHVPTQTVFSNWPTAKTPMNYVWSLDFSPQSKFMAIGNDKGKCLLYRLSHYNKD
jgi:U3 small nucleolar RNA-associated protein 18